MFKGPQGMSLAGNAAASAAVTSAATAAADNIKMCASSLISHWQILSLTGFGK